MILPFLTHGWWVLGQTIFNFSSALLLKYEVQSNSGLLVSTVSRLFQKYGKCLTSAAGQIATYTFFAEKEAPDRSRDKNHHNSRGGWLAAIFKGPDRRASGADGRARAQAGLAGEGGRERSFSQAAEAASCGRGRIPRGPRRISCFIVNCDPDPDWYLTGL